LRIGNSVNELKIIEITVKSILKNKLIKKLIITGTRLNDFCYVLYMVNFVISILNQ